MHSLCIPRGREIAMIPGVGSCWNSSVTVLKAPAIWERYPLQNGALSGSGGIFLDPAACIGDSGRRSLWGF
jgi:hypothetical protein